MDTPTSPTLWSTVKETMSRSKSPLRPVVLGFLALAMVVLPDPVFFMVTDKPAEVEILRMLALVGVSLLAVLPWVTRAGGHLRRRLRRWSIPGVVATAVYLVSGDPLFLILGFCLLVGSSLDMWVTRAHAASDSLWVQVTSRDGDLDR